MAEFIDCCKYCRNHRLDKHGDHVLCCLDPVSIEKSHADWCSKFEIGGENCELRLKEVTEKGERVFTKKQQKNYQMYRKVEEFTRLKIIPKDYLRYDIWYEEE